MTHKKLLEAIKDEFDIASELESERVKEANIKITKRREKVGLTQEDLMKRAILEARKNQP